MKCKPFMMMALFVFVPISFSNAQNNDALVLDSKRQTLSLSNTLLPQWLTLIVAVNNPDLQYNFIVKDSTNFHKEGWYKVDKPGNWDNYFLSGTSSFSPKKEFIEQGWFYSNRPVNGLPDGWYFSPPYHLFFNKEGIFKLSRFFENQLDKIKTARQDQPNTISENEFIKVIVEPAKDVALVKAFIPNNWVVAYQKRIKLGEGQHIMVLIPITKVVEWDQDPQHLKFSIIYRSKRVEDLHYKAFFSLKSQLIS